MLAQAVREVERAVTNRQLTSGQRSRYQAVALLARAERTRVRADDSLTEQQRDTQLKRLDGVATILAQTAAREPSLFHLLADDAEISDNTRRLEREMQAAAGLEPEPEPEAPSGPVATGVRPERKVLPQSVLSAQLANPFLVPDFSQAAPRVQGRLAGWELITPLLNSFEQAAPGSPACMDLPEPRPMLLPPGRRPDGPPVPAARLGGRRATAPSCWPTSPASARPRRRCSPRRSRTPTPCSRSCPTS